MDRLGHRPGETAKLVVRDPASGDTKTLDHAAISGEKRLTIYAAAHNDQAQAVPHALAWAKLSPFTAVRAGSDAADVEFEGKVYFLESIDDLPTSEILAGSRRYDGRRWIKRFAEDLVEVMDHMGHRPGETVKLVLRDPQSGEINTIDHAPMTAENRAKVYATRFVDLGRQSTHAVALPKRRHSPACASTEKPPTSSSTENSTSSYRSTTSPPRRFWTVRGNIGGVRWRERFCRGPAGCPGSHGPPAGRHRETGAARPGVGPHLDGRSRHDDHGEPRQGLCRRTGAGGRCFIERGGTRSRRLAGHGDPIAFSYPCWCSLPSRLWRCACPYEDGNALA